MYRFAGLLLLLLSLFAGTAVLSAAESTPAVPEVPAKGMVTVVDVGADKCIPCKMMAPILKELEEEYKGKAAIVFIDVWKNPEQRSKFNVRVIPTQIFYNREGNEVSRHEGFLDKTKIVEMLGRLGAGT